MAGSVGPSPQTSGMSSFKGARNRTLSRDGYRCRRCFRYRVPLTIHHIKPRRESGTNEAENLITLCCDCHALWHDGEHTTQWESFADFLGAAIHLSPWQLLMLQKCSPIRENQVCVRWPLSLEQLSERLWRWRWTDKPIELMRKRKYGYVSYHYDFTLSRGPTINYVRPYNDSSLPDSPGASRSRHLPAEADTPLFREAKVRVDSDLFWVYLRKIFLAEPSRREHVRRVLPGPKEGHGEVRHAHTEIDERLRRALEADKIGIGRLR